MNELATTQTALVRSFGAEDVDAQMTRVEAVAKVLMHRIKQHGLSVTIQTKQGPKDHVCNEGWTLLAGLIGVHVGISEVTPVGGSRENPQAYVAKAEAVTLDGSVVGRGTAMCSRDEKRWANAPAHQLMSMAQTRASSKSMQSYRWIVKLAGYEGTPAEEIEAGIPGSQPPPSSSGVIEHPPCCPNFGRDGGEPVADVETSSLEWYYGALSDSINDPSKARWKAENEAAQAVIKRELDLRNVDPAPRTSTQTPSPRPATHTPQAGEVPCCPPFGRDASKPVSQAATNNLEWYVGALKRSIDDPDKARFRDANLAVLRGIEDELERRLGPVDPPLDPDDPSQVPF